MFEQRQFLLLFFVCLFFLGGGGGRGDYINAILRKSHIILVNHVWLFKCASATRENMSLVTLLQQWLWELEFHANKKIWIGQIFQISFEIGYDTTQMYWL